MQVITNPEISTNKHNEATPDPSSHPADEKLWLDFKGGSRSAFAVIYKNHFFSLYQYGQYRGYAQDVVKDCIQDLFVELWKYRENLKNTDSIGFYLLKSLRHKLSHYSPTTPLPDVDVAPFNVESVEDQLIEEQTVAHHKAKVLEALHMLTGRQKEVIQLKYYENLKSEEIADRLSISVASVYNLVSKALLALKKSLAKAHFLILLLFL